MKYNVYQNKIYKNFIFILLVSLFLCLIVTGTYAWLSTYYESEGEIAFDTETTDYIPVSMWIYNTSSEGNAGWRKLTAERLGTDDEEARFPSILVNTIDTNVYSNTYIYDIKSLHFGSINNLISLSDDNIVYCRFDFSTVENGTYVILDITEPSNSIGGYDQNGNELRDEVKNALNTLDKTDSHVNFEYAYSSVECVPGDANFGNLNWSNNQFLDEEEINAYHLEEDIGLEDNHEKEKYYLYLRISPNLHTLGYSATILSRYMPCQITFDWDIELTVHPVTNN